MKGLIDIYKIKDLYSGLGQFSLHLAKNLIDTNNNLHLDFLIPDKNIVSFFNKTHNVNFTKTNILLRYFSQLNNKYDFWHSTQQFPSFLPDKKTIQILTIHDLNFLYVKTPEKIEKYRKKLQKNIDRANLITSISEFTKNEILENFNLKGKNISVIYNGVNEKETVNLTKPEFIDDSKFFFSLGVFKSSKNFHTLLKIMKYFADTKLIIAGNCNTEYGKMIRELIINYGYDNRVILPGIINNNEKNWLYQNCSAFLLTSIAEGFGLPVIEAMKFGKPVFLSRFGSLPEIGDKFAWYFDDFSEESMVSVIKNGLLEYSKNTSLYCTNIIQHSSKFTWQKCANEYLQLYNEIIS
jgi:glycosyltransferase involved in cell wall biosynthesis